MSPVALAFLNIAGSGMTGYPYEQELGDMDPYTTSLVMQRNPDIIVGTKIGHFQSKRLTEQWKQQPV